MVGAPTPAPVASPTELIPGYYSDKQPPQEPLHNVGDRIKCGEHIGTIKYIGEVAGYAGLWYGVEWDDPSRGRHSGCVDGVQYFVTTQVGAGSFVRPNRAAPVQSAADAIRAHYAGHEDSVTAAHLKCAINEWQHDIGAPFVRMIGFEKIADKQGLHQLREACVPDSCVSSAGSLGELCPRLERLDLAGNLLSSWREVVRLTSQLPHLSDINVSKNRLRIDLSPEELRHISNRHPSLKKINLSHCAVTWCEIVELANLWPGVEELMVAHNRIESMSAPPATVLRSLTTLILDGNPLHGWSQVLHLTALPQLRVLSLNECGLSEIRVDEALKPFPALRELWLNRNNIGDWQSISELGKLPALRRLYLRHNPVQTAEPYDTVAQLVIARIGTLQELNGSAVTEETRRGAEYDYLKRHGAEWKRDREETARQHPRFAALVRKYGLPEDSLLGAGGGPAALATRLITLHLQDERGDTRVNRFPANMMVGKLVTFASRIFGLRSEPQLYVLDRERGGLEIALDNHTKDLNYFSVRDGDTVLVRRR